MKRSLSLKLKSLAVATCFFAYSFNLQAQSWPPTGMNGDGSSGNPWQITTTAHLEQLAKYINAGNGYKAKDVYYKLMNNINLNEYSKGLGWKPIGDFSSNDSTTIFQGNFDGNNKIIQNLTINRPSESIIGLFGYILNSRIENLGVENCNITGQYIVGGLWGRAQGFTNANCHITGNVSGKRYIGGIGGFTYSDGSITDCYVTGNLNGTDQYLGGLIGYNQGTSISNCYTTCDVNGNNDIGGLVGENRTNSPISNCYTTGYISGQNDIGGLIGLNTTISLISNCYTTSNVNGNLNIGGFVGRNIEGPISKCYATGNVSGNRYIGGFTGTNAYGPISNCYANGNVNGNGDNVGGFAGYNNNTSISKCYATGNVKGNGDKIGGLVGANQMLGSIRSCVAANKSVISDTNTINISRVVGFNSITSNSKNNYAFIGMTIKNSNGNVTFSEGLDSIAGIGKDISTLRSSTFYTNAANWFNNDEWSTSVWGFCDGKCLPWLRWQEINCDTIGLDIIENIKTLNIKVYPNPTNGQLIVENRELKIETIDVFDVFGKNVGIYKNTSYEIKIDISHLSEGIYFLRIQSDNGIITQKIIKQ